MRVLVVEDEEFLAEMIAEGLRRVSLTVDLAHDGIQGVQKLRLMEYDVVVLDRDLPGLHGDDVCRWILSERLLTRVLMLTASTRIDERVEGLSLGADDYLTKPFAHEELAARVLALGRRVNPAQAPVMIIGDVAIDSNARKASRRGVPLDLTPKEFLLLETLARAQGAAVSNEDLIERVWEETTSYRTNAVRITLSNLRKKLGEPTLIETVHGVGYRVIGALDPTGTVA